jgi:hypothetical protein
MSFVLTADLDWASEFCIEFFLDLAARYAITPTLFVTHASAAAREAGESGRADLAIHPNFLSDSSHGEEPDQVIDHVLRLVPAAQAVRCHRYHAPSGAEQRLFERGLRVDSNLCRHLERGLQPMALASGLLRLPVFFEDDMHWTRGFTWDYAAYEEDFRAEGLKILNFHPFFVSLNVPDAAFYASRKAFIPTLSREQASILRHSGPGAGTFLVETIEATLLSGGRFVSLRQLVENNPAWNPTTDSHPEPQPAI